jgi:hypothetical protein
MGQRHHPAVALPAGVELAAFRHREQHVLGDLLGLGGSRTTADVPNTDAAMPRWS